MSAYILALDQGTTSSRAIVFNAKGDICSLAQEEFPQYFPEPGLVEHDALEIWESQLRVAQLALRRAGIDAAHVAAIGVTNQRETTVVWDRATGVPICPAIVWQDRRTASLCAQLREEGREQIFRERTGLLLDPYFSGTKLRWILDHVPEARARAARGELAFGTVDSWLAFKLCGCHITDASNASRTLLFDVDRLQWDQELLDILQIPHSLLPTVVPTSAVLGKTRPELFGRELPLAALVGDQQAACFGQACLHPGMAKNTYGTGCFALLNTGKVQRSEHKLLASVGWTGVDRGTTYVLEGSVFVGGAVVQWLRDGLGVIQSAQDIEKLALSVPDAGGVFMVPAFTGLGAPHWDPDARGAILGITRGATAAHIARAAIQSIGYQVAELLLAMQEDTGSAIRELRVDGGAAKNDLLMQFQADLLGIPVVRPQITETTAMGAAFLAGLAVGLWESTAEIETLWRVERDFVPGIGESERKERLSAWAKAVQAARTYR